MKRFVLLVSLISVLFSGTAQASPVTDTFDIVTEDAQYQRWLRRGLRSCPFDWSKLQAAVVERYGDDESMTINVVADIEGDSLGWAHALMPLIQLEQMDTRFMARHVALHEVGHQIDFLILTEAQREELMAMYDSEATGWWDGEYADQIAEEFAHGFTRACAPSYYMHSEDRGVKTTKAIASRIQEMLGIDPAEVQGSVPQSDGGRI